MKQVKDYLSGIVGRERPSAKAQNEPKLTSSLGCCTYQFKEAPKETLVHQTNEATVHRPKETPVHKFEME